MSRPIFCCIYVLREVRIPDIGYFSRQTETERDEPQPGKNGPGTEPDCLLGGAL